MKRDFKGIWIPKEIWFCTELKATEKVLLAIIHNETQQGGFTWTNQEIADFFSLSPRRCSSIIQKLKERGYLTVEFVLLSELNTIQQRVITENVTEFVKKGVVYG